MKRLISVLIIVAFMSINISCSNSGDVVTKEQAAAEAKSEITADNVEKAADDLLKELESELK